LRDIIDYVAAGKSNSSLGVMPMHNTYYGGALAPIPEEYHGISGEFKPEYS
jgi:hypothetical protein